MKILVLGGNDYKNYFENVGKVKYFTRNESIRCHQRIKSLLTEANLLVLTGGTDINHDIYGGHYEPFADQYDHERDNLEIVLWKQARSLGIPVVGICRGFQLMAALNGHKLIQHLHHDRGHLSGHQVITSDGKSFFARGNHHQAVMDDEKLNVELVSLDNVVEAASWKGQFGVQFHPEWHDWKDPASQWFADKVHDLVK